MTNAITHFEIHGEEEAKLAQFYGSLFGWEIEQMPGVEYWRIQVPSTSNALAGGLTYRAIPGLNGWLLFVNVESMDKTLRLIESLGGSVIRPKTAVPRTAWVTIVSDTAGNMFGVWQADPKAFPPPEIH